MFCIFSVSRSIASNLAKLDLLAERGQKESNVTHMAIVTCVVYFDSVRLLSSMRFYILIIYMVIGLAPTLGSAAVAVFDYFSNLRSSARGLSNNSNGQG
jgi:hypothetical protein